MSDTEGVNQENDTPYPGFRYTLPVPTVGWVHFLYLKPLVCIPFSTGAIWDVSTKNLVFTYFGV